MAYYNQSIPSALLDVFPDIGLNKNCFKMQGQVTSMNFRHIWIFKIFCTYAKKDLLRDTETKRKFFLKIATENGFDALKAENWYSCSKQAVMATQVQNK